MQEEAGTVSFEPMYDGYASPWFTKLFIFYLLFVLILLFVRIVQIAVALRNMRKLQKNGTGVGVTFDASLSDCYFKAGKLKSYATLTVLLSALNFSWQLSDILLDLRVAKTMSPVFLGSRIGESLVPLSMGLIFCIALYVAAMISESALRRSSILIEQQCKSRL